MLKKIIASLLTVVSMTCYADSPMWRCDTGYSDNVCFLNTMNPEAVKKYENFKRNLSVRIEVRIRNAKLIGSTIFTSSKDFEFDSSVNDDVRNDKVVLPPDHTKFHYDLTFVLESPQQWQDRKFKQELNAKKSREAAKLAEQKRLATCSNQKPYVGMPQHILKNLCDYQVTTTHHSDYGHTTYTHYSFKYGRIIVRNNVVSSIHY